MPENSRFSIFVLDGEVSDFSDIDTPYLRYEGLSWADAVELARLSFTQGFTVCIWQLSDGDSG